MLKYILGVVTFALVVDVTYDLYNFNSWQSVSAGILLAYCMYHFAQSREKDK